MRLLGSDPDVQTLISRIFNGDYDLQPDFQRGEVWSEIKKRRLIDTILREWHVPPIHVVEIPSTAKVEVLDGQQRLAAIRDFALGRLAIDGYTEPVNQAIVQLHGMRYEELPPLWRRRFDRFQIRVFMITDYEPSEPGELFFRLNQPTNLTAAEQRNAFFGPARQQVKQLVDMFETKGLTEEILGFSNSRMAYDDVIAKLCLSLDKGTLLEQVTASSVTGKYRSMEMFDPKAFARATESISLLAEASRSFLSKVKFNKTTLYSWLCFIAEIMHPVATDVSTVDLGRFISEFESRRAEAKSMSLSTPQSFFLSMFTDRASSRVSDVSSVLIRDVILWIFFRDFVTSQSRTLNQANPRVAMLERLSGRSAKSEADAQFLVSTILNTGWGRTL